MTRCLRVLVPHRRPGTWIKLLNQIRFWARAMPRTDARTDLGDVQLNVGFRRWAFRLVAGFVKGTADAAKCWEEILAPLADEVQKAFDDQGP